MIPMVSGGMKPPLHCLARYGLRGTGCTVGQNVRFEFGNALGEERDELHSDKMSLYVWTSLEAPTGRTNLAQAESPPILMED